MQDDPQPHLVTQWLAAWRDGDDHARDQLFSAVYPPLRRVAARFLQQERANHTLEPAALVNEVAVRLLGSGPVAYNDRTHFFAIAAQMMRRILIDHARTGAAAKRGGVQHRVNLSSIEGRLAGPSSADVLVLDDALSRLEQADPRAARVVELRFFGGLREQEVADILGVSAITVKRDWRLARAWLINQLRPS